MSRNRPRWPKGVPRRLTPRIFLTFRHYQGGRSSAKRTGRLYPRRNPWYSLSEAVSTSGHMVLSGEPRKKSPVTPPEIDPRTFRLVAQCLNHYATPGQQKGVPGFFPREERRPVRRADNLTTFMWWLSWNLGTSISWKPQTLVEACKGTALQLPYTTQTVTPSKFLNHETFAILCLCCGRRRQDLEVRHTRCVVE